MIKVRFFNRYKKRMGKSLHFRETNRIRYSFTHHLNLEAARTTAYAKQVLLYALSKTQAKYELESCFKDYNMQVVIVKQAISDQLDRIQQKQDLFKRVIQFEYQVLKHIYAKFQKEKGKKKQSAKVFQQLTDLDLESNFVYNQAFSLF